MKIKMIIITILCTILFIPNIVFTENQHWFTSKAKREYSLKTSQLDIEINSNINNKSINIDMDKLVQDTVEADIDIENTGDSDLFVRVLIFPTITDGNNDEWIGRLNLDKIKFNYNNNDDKSKPDDDYWYEGNDGYIYYKKILKSKENIENKLLDSISVDIDESEMNYYKGKVLNIDIVVEAVQSKNEEYKDAWNSEDLELVNILE